MTVYVLEDGKLVVKRASLERRLQIVRDIQPYQSMVDGSRITSRSKHREHLKAHGCIEVGNETQEAPKPFRTSQAQRDERKRMLYQQFDSLSPRQIKQVATELREIARRR